MHGAQSVSVCCPMPNWCQNKLLVWGSDLQTFRDWLGEDVELTLAKINPTPARLMLAQAPFNGTEEESAALVEKYGYDNWYDWNVFNWGTKWDIEAEYDEMSSNQHMMFFSFPSAWSPPTIAIKRLSQMFSLNAQIVYFEEGNGFAGYETFEKGETVDTFSLTLQDSNKKEWQNFVREYFGWELEEDEENA